jgi:hypothetical protein
MASLASHETTSFHVLTVEDESIVPEYVLDFTLLVLVDTLDDVDDVLGLDRVGVSVQRHGETGALAQRQRLRFDFDRLSEHVENFNLLLLQPRYDSDCLCAVKSNEKRLLIQDYQVSKVDLEGN